MLVENKPIMLSLFILSVVILSVVILNVAAPKGYWESYSQKLFKGGKKSWSHESLFYLCFQLL
jgi:hypothetical protein